MSSRRFNFDFGYAIQTLNRSSRYATGRRDRRQVTDHQKAPAPGRSAAGGGRRLIDREVAKRRQGFLDGPRLWRAPRGSTRPRLSVVPLRLGAVVAGDPAADDETAEIETALGPAVMLAHDPGGAAGRPVELVVARSDDAAVVAELFRSVDVIVGGSGMPATPAALWIFETDPAISGTGVLPAESSPRDVLGATAAPGRYWRRSLGPVVDHDDVWSTRSRVGKAGRTRDCNKL